MALGRLPPPTASAASSPCCCCCCCCSARPFASVGPPSPLLVLFLVTLFLFPETSARAVWSRFSSSMSSTKRRTPLRLMPSARSGPIMGTSLLKRNCSVT